MTVSAAAPGTSQTARTWCLTCRAIYRSAFARCPHDGGELVVAEEDPLVGTTLAGRYVIERVLGEGGLGHVYAARHVRMSRRYAIKVPYGELTHDAVARERFLREADVVGRLEHPAVVAATDVGETDQGLLYLAMDLAEGFALDVVLEAGPMPGHRIPVLLEQLLAGLAHAHERGVVHRDLKPGNVIVDRDRARIVDFGIAALVEDAASGRTRLTTEGQIIGTPEYMAPEQVTGRGADARSDLFALGVVLYEMLSGKLPFSGNPMEVAMQNMVGDPPRIAVRAPEAGPVDPLIEAVARWMMETGPAARPQTAADALAVVRLIRSDRAAAARKLAPWLEAERTAVGMDLDSRATTRVPVRAKASTTIQPIVVSATPAADGAAARRSRMFIAGIALLPVALLAVWWAQTRSVPEPRDTDVRVDGAPPPAVAVQPQPEPAPPPRTDPAPPNAPFDSAATPPRSGRTEGKPPAPIAKPATTTRQPATATRQPPPATDSSSFYDRYTSVGEALAAYRKAHGDDAAADLLRRYRAIAYLEAVRDPDLRTAAMRELDAISRALASRASSRP